jgi:GT2 family glycosyltransferase
MSVQFGVVVNYFSKPTHPVSVKYSVKFALSLLKNCPEVIEIVLSDGSANRDDELNGFCSSLDIQYLHSGKILTFSEGYNAGVRQLTSDWVVTMASDIYVTPTTFTAINQFITNSKDPNRIGCLIPYLSKSDLPTQQYANSLISRDCRSPGMTFNLNVFNRRVYDLVGGVTKDFTGNFNDFEMCLKLREHDLNVYLVGNSYAVHYGQLTLRFGSHTDSDSDSIAFYKKHPELYEKGGFWSMKFNTFFESKILKAMYFPIRLFPAQFKRKYTILLLKIAPLFQRY